MKTKLLPLLLLAILSVRPAIAQNNAFWAGFGIQASRMDDLKYYQELILNNWPVEGKKTSSFPIYTTGSFGFMKQLYPAVRIGGGYSHSVTGAKSDYTDYSGYVSSEMLATSHRAGAYGSYLLLGGDWIELSLSGKLEIKYTTIELTSSIYALGYSDRYSTLYSSISPGGSAGLELLVHLRDFSFGLEGAYEADVPGKLYDRDTKDDLLDPADPDRILTSDWSGWYTQLKVLWWIDN